MSRQNLCGRHEAQTRVEVAQGYLDVAEVAGAGEPTPVDRNVAAGNAVLAAIAAADALCCLRLGTRSREANHAAAVTLLQQVDRDLSRDLATVLAIKDSAHYGQVFLGGTRLSSVLRATHRLVEAAQAALKG